jgi:TPR repeat protein
MLKGLGVEANAAKGMEWIKKAAQSGLSAAVAAVGAA